MTRYASRPFVEPRMLALSLRQPGPWALCRARSLLVNRTWNPGQDLKRGGPLAIHAGLEAEDVGHLTPGWPEDVDEPPPALDFVRLRDETGRRIAPDPEDPALSLGAVVAVAIFDRVVGRLPASSPQAKWRTTGGCGWLFSCCDPLPAPVPCRGKRKLWRLDEVESRRVLELWAREMM